MGAAEVVSDTGPWVRAEMRRSKIGAKPKTRGALRALGLRRIGQSIVIPDNEHSWGQLRRVQHLVTIERIGDSQAPLWPELAYFSPDALPYVYDLPGGHGTGSVVKTQRGWLLRVEHRQTQDGSTSETVLGWLANREVGKLLRTVHASGNPDSRFYVVKNRRLIGYEPWTPTLPHPLAESPKQVETVRLVAPKVGCSVERDGSGLREVLVSFTPANRDSARGLVERLAGASYLNAMTTEGVI